MKRLAIRAAYVVALYALMEICSFIALRVIGEGFGTSAFTLAGLWEEQQRRVESAPDLFGRGALALHPYLGYVYDPEVHRAGSRGFSVNPHGLLGEAGPPPRRGKGRVVIGIFGGSVALGLADRVLADEFRASPRFAGKEIVFVKAALGAYKQPQQLMTLNYLLVLGAEFDIVINMDGFNDVALHGAYNQPKGVYPMFPNGWYFLTQNLAANSSTLRLVGQIAFFDSLRQSWANGLSRLSWLHSATLTLVWKAGDQHLANRTTRLQLALRQAKASDESYVTHGPVFPYASEDEVYEDLARVWKNGSIQLDRLSRANGIAYFHFLQPNQYVPHSKRLTAEERRQAYLDDHPYRRGVERGYPLLAHEGQDLVRRGVRFRDLSMVFADHSEAIYIDTCCHFNHAGYQIVAREIARTILRALSPPA